MCFSKTNLPEEIVLMIFNLLPLWHDRLQFAACCKHNWNCVLENGSVSNVDIFQERNLLKFKLARSATLNLNVAVERFHARAFKFFSVCTKLKTFVVRDILISTSVIESILKAAGGTNRCIDITVPQSTLHLWRHFLERQKFREGLVRVECEYEDEVTAPEVMASSCNEFETLMTEEGYERCKMEHVSEGLLMSNIEEHVTSLGQSFVGSIILFEEVSVMVTSFDAFVHIANLDDCSFDNKWIDKNPFAKLHHKFEKSRNFFELSIILHGCLELLVVGGVVALKGKPAEPFLGSSVKPLKNAATIDGDRISRNIFVKADRQEVVRSERLLRQYYKDDSCKMWSFHWKPLHHIGFYPVNPLKVDEHPSVSSIPLSIQSLIMNTFANKRFSHQKASTLIERMKRDKKFLKGYLKLDEANFQNFRTLIDGVAIDGKWKEMVRILKMLEAGEITLGTSKKEIVSNKKIVLNVGSRGFLKALSDINDKRAKIAKASKSL